MSIQADEYKTLRDEILQGKKWVFERPLLIITISIALVKYLEDPFLFFLPILIIGVMFFNLWFTVNRLKSIARIVAYIQLVHENDNHLYRWIGWESSLRYWRKWIKGNEKKIHNIVEKNLDKDTIPDAIGYYPVIYFMHIGIVILVFVSTLFYTLSRPSFIQIVSFVVCAGFIAKFYQYTKAAHPRKLGNAIEESRIIWMQFLTIADKGQADFDDATKA